MTDAVIFDFDGTLVDSTENIIKSMKKTLLEFNCPVDDIFIQKRIGIGANAIIVDALNKNSIPPDDDLIERITSKLISNRLSYLDLIHLQNGAVSLLDSLKDRIRIALATMGIREVLTRILEDRSLKEYFEVIVAADDCVNPKPNPEIFLKCAKKLNLEPEKCVVIEDSIFGVQAAKYAGMKCIAVTSGFYDREQLKEADLILPSISEKRKIFDFIFS